MCSTYMSLDHCSPFPLGYQPVFGQRLLPDFVKSLLVVLKWNGHVNHWDFLLSILDLRGTRDTT